MANIPGMDLGDTLAEDFDLDFCFDSVEQLEKSAQKSHNRFFFPPFFGSVTSYQLLQKGEWPFNQLKFLFTLFWNEVVNVNKVRENIWLCCS